MDAQQGKAMPLRLCLGKEASTKANWDISVPQGNSFCCYFSYFDSYCWFLT